MGWGHTACFIHHPCCTEQRNSSSFIKKDKKSFLGWIGCGYTSTLTSTQNEAAEVLAYLACERITTIVEHAIRLVSLTVRM